MSPSLHYPDVSRDIQVPSDLFMVITYCREVGVSIHNCGNDSLDVISFIIPDKQTVNNNCKVSYSEESG